MTKLRFLDKKASETYLKQLKNEKARLAILIRLNMFEAFTHNFGYKNNCTLCGHENDTTEHAFECPKRNNKEVTVADLKNGTRMNEIVEMCLDMENKRRDILIDDIVTKVSVLHAEEWMERRTPEGGIEQIANVEEL